MTLAEFFAAVAPHLKPTHRKDVQTSVRYLALALGKNSPTTCQPDDYLKPLAELKTKVDAYLTPLNKGARTLYNTHTNLAQLFRLGKALGLLEIPAPKAPQMTREKIYALEHPYQARMSTPTYRLRLEEWPTDLRQAWETFAHRHGRRVRAITVTKYQKELERFLGFLIGIEQQPVTSWEPWLSPTWFDAFVRWHTSRHGVRSTVSCFHMAEALITFATVLYPDRREELLAYRRELPRPAPMHRKRNHWIHPAELEQVGLTLLEESQRPFQKPDDKRLTGSYRALKMGHALMLRLLLRIPLRSRNLREIRLRDNLYQAEGRWQLSYQPEELKVTERRDGPNCFDLEFPEDLVAHLEAFIGTPDCPGLRSRLPNADTSPYLFLTQAGKPYSGPSIRKQLFMIVFQRIGKRFYPHLIRTIWSTEMIKRGLGVDGVAALLNNTPATVWGAYHDLLISEHYDHSQALVRSLLRSPHLSQNSSLSTTHK